MKNLREIDKMEDILRGEFEDKTLLSFILKELDTETKEKVFKSIANDWDIEL